MKYTRAEFIILMIMLILNVFFVIIIVGFGNLTGFVVSDKSTIPSDYIKDSDIKYKDNKLTIEIDNVILKRFEDTKSMEPVLGYESTGIAIKPTTPEEISVGDIISFERDGIVIVHRVIEKGTDVDGIYFITKGDNSDIVDGKVRFSEINSVLVGVLY